jgi:hypothetical protein
VKNKMKTIKILRKRGEGRFFFVVESPLIT